MCQLQCMNGNASGNGAIHSWPNGTVTRRGPGANLPTTEFVYHNAGCSKLTWDPEYCVLLLRQALQYAANKTIVPLPRKKRPRPPQTAKTTPNRTPKKNGKPPAPSVRTRATCSHRCHSVVIVDGPAAAVQVGRGAVVASSDGFSHAIGKYDVVSTVTRGGRYVLQSMIRDHLTAILLYGRVADCLTLWDRPAPV